MKHTKGKVEISSNENHSSITISNKNTIICVLLGCPDEIEIQANAEIIADAFNTTNECGLTPCELFKHNRELLNCLIMADRILQMNNKDYKNSESEKEIKQAIKNSTNDRN